MHDHIIENFRSLIQPCAPSSISGQEEQSNGEAMPHDVPNLSRVGGEWGNKSTNKHA